jgi:hypothetical protein
MALRKILVGVLTMAMVSPVWGGGEPLGNITSSNDATIRDSKLTPGSSVFAGDEISVAAHGGVRIALTGGAQAEVLGNSSVRLAMADNKIQMVVNRGQASFHASGPNGISAVVADATVRPAGGAETSAIIQSLSETHAIVAAEKGALLVTTANDGKVYTVREGEAADFSAVPDPQQNGGAVPAGKAAPRISVSKKKAVIWVVVIGGAGVAVTAYLLSRRETKLSTTTLGNEISPHALN